MSSEHTRSPAALLLDRHQYPLAVAIIIAAILLPLVCVLNRPFHLDDTLFIYTARQVLKAPLDPYGFMVNWEGSTKPMWAETKNPPLISYYLAMMMAFFNEKEWVLHASFLPFVFLCLWSFYQIGKRFSRSPLFGLALFAATPAFMVSASTLMADIPSLAVSLWALTLFIAGNEKRSSRLLIAAHLLVGIAMLIKFSAVIFVLLFLVYHFLYNKKKKYLFFFAIPLGIFLAWHLYSLALYQYSHIGISMKFSYDIKRLYKPWFEQGFALLTFLSGCSASLVFLIARTFDGFSKRRLPVLLSAFVGGLAAAYARVFLSYSLSEAVLIALLTVASLGMIGSIAGTLALSGNARSKTENASWRDNVFLGLWFFIALAFVFFISWSIAARFILLVIPPMSLVFVNILYSRKALYRRSVVAGVFLAYLMSALILYQDTQMAWGFKTLVSFVEDELKLPREKTYFLMDWGFKYYLEEKGYRGIDITKTVPRSGDYVVTFLLASQDYIQKLLLNKRQSSRSLFGADLGGVPVELELETIKKIDSTIPIAVTNRLVHAAFHCSVHGLLPFVFSDAPLITLSIWKVC